MHLCVSGTPECSALNPCIDCFRIIIERILPRAMAVTGGPYTDPEWGPPFIQNFIPAWRSVLLEIGPQIQQTLNAAATPPPQAQASGADLASAARQVEEASQAIGQATTEPPVAEIQEVVPGARVADPATDDPEQPGYPISPERMTDYMRQMRGQVPATSEQPANGQLAPSPAPAPTPTLAPALEQPKTPSPETATAAVEGTPTTTNP